MSVDSGGNIKSRPWISSSPEGLSLVSAVLHNDARLHLRYTVLYGGFQVRSKVQAIEAIDWSAEGCHSGLDRTTIRGPRELGMTPKRN